MTPKPSTGSLGLSMVKPNLLKPLIIRGSVTPQKFSILNLNDSSPTAENSFRSKTKFTKRPLVTQRNIEKIIKTGLDTHQSKFISVAHTKKNFNKTF